MWRTTAIYSALPAATPPRRSEWPGEPFGHAVDDHVESIVDWILQDGRRESVIHDADEVMFAREGCRLAQIDKIQRRIRGRFHVEAFRFRREQ